MNIYQHNQFENFSFDANLERNVGTEVKKEKNVVKTRL